MSSDSEMRSLSGGQNERVIGIRGKFNYLYKEGDFVVDTSGVTYRIIRILDSIKDDRVYEALILSMPEECSHGPNKVNDLYKLIESNIKGFAE